MRYFRMKPDMTFQEVDETIYNLPADGVNWIDNKFTFYQIATGEWIIGECTFKNVPLLRHENLISIIRSCLNYLLMDTGNYN
jgi:hypothetical protein